VKKRTVLAALAAIAAAALVLPTSSAGAQDTVPVFVVHGINVAGETPVNVCVGDDEEPLLGDFVFTDFAGPLDLPVGAEVPIRVYLAPDTCTDDTQIIDQTVTVPGGPVALVATGDGDGGYQLTPFPIDLDCADPGNGRLSAFHASADTGEVTVEVGGAPVGSLAFGQDFSAEVPEGTYPVTVLLGETAVVGPDAEIPVSEGANTLAFVTGNISGDTPVVAIVEGVDIGVCDSPDPDPAPEPTPETPTGPGTAPATPVGAAGERPLALTG